MMMSRTTAPETTEMTNIERARRWIEDRDLGRATVESDVVSLAMQFDKVHADALNSVEYCDVCGASGSDLRTAVEVCRDCYDAKGAFEQKTT